MQFFNNSEELGLLQPNADSFFGYDGNWQDIREAACFSYLHDNGKPVPRWTSPPVRTLPRKTGKVLQHFLGLIFVLKIFTVVSAFNSQICCLKSARSNWTDGTLPWDSCAFGASYVQGTYGLGEVPHVNATLGFCKENCPGVQISTVNECLALLTSWVLPAIALLLTCSIGWKKPAGIDEPKPRKRDPPLWFKCVRYLNFMTDVVLKFPLVPYQLQEFMAILGDPAGAIRGAFSEVVLNMRMVHKLYYPGEFDRLRKGLVMVAGQTKFTDEVDFKLTYFILRNSLSAGIELDHMVGLGNALDNLAEEREQSLKANSLRDEMIPKIWLKMIKEIRSMLIDGEKDNLWKCLQALKDSLACDLGKEHPLVNCAQCKLRLEIIKILDDPRTKYIGKQGIKIKSTEEGNTEGRPGEKGDDLERLFEQCKRVEELRTGIQISLQGRVDFMKGVVLPIILGLVATAGSFYSAYNQIGDNDTAHALAYGVWYSMGDHYCCPSPEKGSVLYKAWSTWKIIIEQTLAWACIGIPCACAASISYTTPTVGLGCRSFNFLLYGICTLVVSWLSAYRGQTAETEVTWSRRVCLRALYIFGVCVNVFIISAGTAFDLIGLYRTCRCEMLFVSNDFLLQMSSNTALDVANAKMFWLPVGYVDFGFIWIVCMIAVTCRSYIAYSINLLLENWNHPSPRTEEFPVQVEDFAVQVGDPPGEVE